MLRCATRTLAEARTEQGRATRSAHGSRGRATQAETAAYSQLDPSPARPDHSNRGKTDDGDRNTVNSPPPSPSQPISSLLRSAVVCGVRSVGSAKRKPSDTGLWKGSQESPRPVSGRGSTAGRRTTLQRYDEVRD